MYGSIVSIAGALIFAATAPFSATSIFALPDHNYIDDRCQHARAFADHASRTTDDIDAPTAIAAASSLSTCFNLPRLNPDENAQRYLYLAMATALYVAATKTTGDDAAALLKKADSMARDLGAVAPDHTVVIEHVVKSYGSAAGNPSTAAQPANVSKDYYVVDRSPFGTAHPGRFTDEANQLLNAIGDEATRQASRPQAADTAAPQTAASAAPAASPAAR